MTDCDFPCWLGHIGCSDREGGLCSAEQYARACDQLETYIEETAGDLEIQTLLRPEHRLPPESIAALQAGLERARAELAELTA